MGMIIFIIGGVLVAVLNVTIDDCEAFVFVGATFRNPLNNDRNEKDCCVAVTVGVGVGVGVCDCTLVSKGIIVTGVEYS